VLEFVPWIFNQLNNSLYTKARCTQSSLRLDMASTLRMPTTISPGSKSHELNQHGLAPGERVSLKHDYIPLPLPSDISGRISFDVFMAIDITGTSPKYEVISTTQKKKKNVLLVVQ